jgi:hypothetical protein
LEEKLSSQDDNDLSDEDDDGVDEYDLDSNVAWNVKFLELRQYRIINGNDPKLWRWVDNQRTAYKNVQSNKNGPKLTTERINGKEGN